MNEIPATFWMIIIGGLAFSLGTVLIYIAMVFKELTGTVAETTNLIKESNEVVKEARETVAMAKNMVSQVKTNIIEPILGIGKVLKSVSQLTNKFNNMTGRNKVDAEETA